MVSKIIDGIALAINGEFGDTYEIYTEAVEQGLTEPCFIVRCINPSSQLFRGKRYQNRNQCVVNYFPASNAVYAELSDVTMRLFDCLALITVDGNLVRGTDMSSQIDGKVLHFFVNYSYFSYRQEDTVAMDEYSHKTDAKG